MFLEDLLDPYKRMPPQEEEPEPTLFETLLGDSMEPGGGRMGASGGGGRGRGGPGGIPWGKFGGDLEVIFGANAFNRSSADSSHPTHLHFGAERGPLVKVLKKIQRMGYDVGEHPKFGGVGAGHTTNSWHYAPRGRAGDINWNNPSKGRASRFGNETKALDWLERWLMRNLP